MDIFPSPLIDIHECVELFGFYLLTVVLVDFFAWIFLRTDADNWMLESLLVWRLAVSANISL